jgi:homoserine dehydrogenase
MSHYNLALIGFGNVGRAFAKLLLRKQGELRAHYNLTFAVTGIATSRHGCAIDHGGLDLERALAASDLRELSTQPVKFSIPALDFIRNSGADILFENSPVNYESGQPAVDHLYTALEMGMHAITANKGPVVHAYRKLTDLAQAKGLKFYFESAVMDGAPIFSLFRETLPAAVLRSFTGVLNSTTNLMLTRMEAGESFEKAFAYAESIGVPETDPSGDIDGWDSAVKVAALVTVLMGIPLKPDQVDRQGIRDITPELINNARMEGKRWKLICSAQRTENGAKGQVTPVMVDASSPFFQTEGTTSVVQFETDVLGLFSVVETDPGPETTAYGLLADFINATRA